MINSYIALDLETTGLNAKVDKIIEIGAIKVINGQTIDIYETFVDAGKKISARITELTGIDDNMLKGAKPQRQAMSELVEFCEDLPLLGHNIIFDYSFIKRGTVNEDFVFDKEGIDTLKIARKYLPDLEKRSLDFLCGYYKIERVHNHRAFEDASAAMKLYERLAFDYYEEEASVFKPHPLLYKVKKQGPITEAQKGYLNDLLKYHKIEIDIRVEKLTKNEASRYIDRIISNYGRIKR